MKLSSRCLTYDSTSGTSLRDGSINVWDSRLHFFKVVTFRSVGKLRETAVDLAGVGGRGGACLWASTLHATPASFSVSLPPIRSAQKILWSVHHGGSQTNRSSAVNSRPKQWRSCQHSPSPLRDLRTEPLQTEENSKASLCFAAWLRQVFPNGQGENLRLVVKAAVRGHAAYIT